MTKKASYFLFVRKDREKLSLAVGYIILKNVLDIRRGVTWVICFTEYKTELSVGESAGITFPTKRPNLPLQITPSPS